MNLRDRLIRASRRVAAPTVKARPEGSRNGQRPSLTAAEQAVLAQRELVREWHTTARQRALNAAILVYLKKPHQRRRFAEVMYRTEWRRNVLNDNISRFYEPIMWLALREVTARADTVWFRTGRTDTTGYWAIISATVEIISRIYKLDAWKDSALDETGARLDLTAELIEITEQMLESASIAATIGAPVPLDTPEGVHAQQAVQRQHDALDQVRASAMARLNALYQYFDRLAAVDAQTRAVEQAQRAANVDGRVDDLIRKTGRDDIAGTRIGSAAGEVRNALAARSQALAEVRGDYLNAFTSYSGREPNAAPHNESRL